MKKHKYKAETASKKEQALPATDKPGPGPAKKGKEPSEAARNRPDVDAERLLRLQADFENFRKRTLREKGEIYRRSNEQVLEELLPVLDHLDIALAAAQEHGADKAFVEGFRLVSEQMLSVLKKFGLIPTDAQGDEFDPNRHEAISHLTSDDVPQNVVMTQVRRGYLLGDKLLRAAQVVVSSGSAAPPEEEPTEPEQQAAEPTTES